MGKILISWIGSTDLKACKGAKDVGMGPLAQAVIATEYDEIALLSDYPPKENQTFLRWLQKQSAAPVSINKVKLTSPTNFEEIYQSATSHVAAILEGHGPEKELVFHLSPGTSHMMAVWVIIAKTRYPAAELIESSREHGVKDTTFPFDISADFIPELFRRQDEALKKLSAGLPSEAPEFSDIIHRSKEMQRVILRAQRVALRSIPTLIEGDSGTGKELLARAIHQSGPRKTKPFIPVNCGAISPELIESELFGHVKGAFTSAAQARSGHFESANGGTLFLDEIGELPVMAQVKLLRVLQEGEITKVGSSTPIKLDVRIIAATNRSLMDEVAKGRFREDLFYRLAVAVINLPPLSKREGDISLLIERLLEQVNKESEIEPGYKHKKISAGAKNLMMQHSWPGNVRELLNTIRRAAVWSPESTITEGEMRDALLPVPSVGQQKEGVLGRSVADGIDLPGIMSLVARHYLQAALKEAGDNKTKASKLLGISNYQTLTNWLKKYGLE